MPNNAVEAGVVDAVATPDELPTRILGARRPRGSGPTAGPSTVLQDDSASLHEILDRIAAETGHDFSEYKPSTLLRRIERRISARRLTSIADYAALVAHESAELRLLAQAMLIGVTAYFRDPTVWEHLAQAGLPPVLAALPTGRELRAWVSDARPARKHIHSQSC